MQAAVESLSDEWDDEEEVGGLEDAFARAQIFSDGRGRRAGDRPQPRLRQLGRRGNVSRHD